MVKWCGRMHNIGEDIDTTIKMWYKFYIRIKYELFAWFEFFKSY